MPPPPSGPAVNQRSKFEAKEMGALAEYLTDGLFGAAFPNESMTRRASLAGSAGKPWALISLPPFPAVAARVLQLLSQDGTGLKELADIIRADIAFSAEVLTLANSALFATASEIRTVLQATVLLGLNRVKAIAMTVGLRSYLTDSMKIPALLACWRHSLACAILCEDLATAAFMERDAAYLAGLLHDVGRLALSVVEPIKYGNILQTSASIPDVRARERELFGADHCEAGKWMAEQWKLPRHFAEVTARHHDPVTSGTFDMVTLVQLGCELADVVGFAAVHSPTPVTIEDVRAKIPQQVLRRFSQSREELALQVAIKINSLDMSLAPRH
jgi:putative nucleotidyltransferase with HDIG domain